MYDMRIECKWEKGGRRKKNTSNLSIGHLVIRKNPTSYNNFARARISELEMFFVDRDCFLFFSFLFLVEIRTSTQTYIRFACALYPSASEIFYLPPLLRKVDSAATIRAFG